MQGGLSEKEEPLNLVRMSETTRDMGRPEKGQSEERVEQLSTVKPSETSGGREPTSSVRMPDGKLDLVIMYDKNYRVEKIFANVKNDKEVGEYDQQSLGQKELNYGISNNIGRIYDGQFVDGEAENLVRMQDEQIRDNEGLDMGRMHDGKSGVCDNNTVSWGRIQNENVLENKDLSGMRMYGGNREVREPQNMVRMPAVNKDEEKVNLGSMYDAKLIGGEMYDGIMGAGCWRVIIKTL